ncbi:outer membrane protein 7 [Chlamydia pneumoniae TW-183]|nr:outer membrane protein 7 [Chlamydia pneumoniae TW-183]
MREKKVVMKIPLRFLLISLVPTLSMSNLLGAATTEELSASNSFDGTTSTTSFSSKTSSATDGTNYVFKDSVVIENVPKTGETQSTSCFKNDAAAGDLNFLGGGFSFTFSNIDATTASGAAIGSEAANKTVTLSGFSALSFLKSPASTVTNGLGAINVKGNLSLLDNDKVLIQDNFSTGDGGAINCAGSLKIANNKSLSFIGNSSSTRGGAIHTKNLTLSSGGETLFQGNTAPTAAGKGGAIAIADSGTLSISGDSGDIIFEGNTIGATGTVSHSAIDLGTSAKITALRAAQGHTIYFYDPITVTGSTSVADALNINSPDTGDNKEYTGTIVFSGEKLTEAEAKDEKNRTSKLLQNVAFKNGTVVLKGDVVLSANGFSQDANSKLIMDLGTSLVANTESIELTNLEINIDSLRNGKKIKLSAATAQKDIRIDRPVVLAISDESFYQNGFLNEDHSYDGILELDAGKDIVISADSRSIDAVQSPYGYQGKWTINWSTDDKKATVSWAKQSFNPTAEQEAPLVPNLLWGSFIDVRSFQNFIELGTEGAPYEKRFWVAGISNVLHRSGRENQRKFRHVSGGAVVGASTRMPGGDTLSLGFAQLFARDKDYFMNTNFAKTYAGSLRLQHDASLYSVVSILLGEGGLREILLPYVSKTLPCSFYGQLSYGHTDHRMKTESLPPPPRRSRRIILLGEDMSGLESWELELLLKIPAAEDFSKSTLHL